MKLKLFLSVVSVLTFFALLLAEPEPASYKEEGAFVRFWNMSSQTNESFNLVCENQTPEFSIRNVRPYETSHYNNIKPGKWVFKILKNKDNTEKFSEVSLNLRQGDYFTIVVWRLDNINVETIDDTYDIKSEKTGKLTIRNFMPGLEVDASIIDNNLENKIQ